MLREPRTSHGLEVLISRSVLPHFNQDSFPVAELNKRKELKELKLQIIPNKVVCSPHYSSIAAGKSKTRTVCYWPAYNLITQSSSLLILCM